MDKTPNETFEGLSTAERILYLQDLWDRIAAEPEQVDVTPAQREELDRRLEDQAASPNAGAPWSDVLSRARGQR